MGLVSASFDRIQRKGAKTQKGAKKRGFAITIAARFHG
ncbi:Hypothetical protein A7982_08906 [Minicystis rosea]|nr:Hypothetical protein A7982_08906 [Minicystis rosea]